MSTFEIRAGVLSVVSSDGEVTHRHNPIGARIVQMLPLGGNVVVREDYYRFPHGRSNIYCLDSELRHVWSAETLTANDAYANPVIEVSGRLVCCSWEGARCTIDPATGRILHYEFAK
jgi:hypothetical protein